MRELLLQKGVWLAVMGMMVGCSRSPERAAQPPRPEGYVVGVSLAGLDTPWQRQLKADVEAAATAHPDLTLIVRDAQNDAARQKQHLEEFLGMRVNAVILYPADSQPLTPPAATLFDAGIPVIVLERPIIGDHYTTFIAANPRQIGEMAGKWLAARLAGKGKIVELKGPVDSVWDQELHGAWFAEFKDPAYRFVYDASVDPPRSDAAKLMTEALGRSRDIAAVMAYDDAAAHAAYETAQAAGRAKGILFVGVGGLPDEGAKYVAEHVLAATFLHPTGGAEAVDAVAKLKQGEKPARKIVLPTRVLSASEASPGK
jgi:ribose transport system substrate-binding protein